jgi:hypothetical protein
MKFFIYAVSPDLAVVEYTVSINASFQEIENASKYENFIAWVVANATQIEACSLGDMTSNDFAETIHSNGDGKLAVYFVASGDDIDLLPPCEEDDC